MRDQHFAHGIQQKPDWSLAMGDGLNILLVQPPPHLPVAGLKLMRFVNQLLAEMDGSADQCLAGIAFYKQFLADSQVLEAAIRESAGGRGRSAEAEMDFLNRGRELVPGLFQTSPDLAGLMASLQWVDGALGLLCAGAPVSLGRKSLTAPGVVDQACLVDFAFDRGQNPFWAFNHHVVQPPDLFYDGVIFLAESAGQAVAAATMALNWQKRWPAVPMTILGIEHQAVKLASGLVESARAGGNPKPWLRLISELSKAIANFSSTGNHNDCNNGGTAGCRVEIDLSGPAVFPDDFDFATRLIVWKGARITPAETARLIYPAAKKGIWNHLVLPAGTRQASVLAMFAGLNPNLVHSWCYLAGPVSLFSDPQPYYPSGCTVYGTAEPMTGRPVWQLVRNPEYLELLLGRMETSELRRMLVGEKDSGLRLVGSDLEYHYSEPQSLAKDLLDQICRMVEAGGTVSMQWVRHNLQRAFLVAYAMEEGLVVANSSLKHPRKEYLDAVSRQAGLDLGGYLERGYTSVRPEYRGLGIGAELLAGLTKRAAGRPIFSVIAEDNVATKKIARRNKTRKVAVFYSQKADKVVGVWIPEWFIPAGVRILE